MSDRRLTPHSGRVALEGWPGEAAARTPGTPMRIAAPLADLRATPGGALDRQLILGAAVRVIDRARGHAFVQAAADGYCGWVEEGALGPFHPVTHRLAVPASHLYPEPRVQAPPLAPLWLTAEVEVTGVAGAWAQTPRGWVPAAHLRPRDTPLPDPVAVAESLLHSPYLWGGNSRAGIDCSGLIQIAHRAAGREVPGDSDLQQAIGRALDPGEEARRGDLIFWRGHVAMVTGPGRLIHANGHTMSVAAEGLEEAAARILAAGGGPVTARRRP